MANREIAHYEQFLHLPHCFQKSSAVNASAGGKGLKKLRFMQPAGVKLVTVNGELLFLKYNGFFSPTVCSILSRKRC